MRILITPQEFKGSLTAVEAAAAILAGVERGLSGAGMTVLPIADGGPGTLNALVAARHGQIRRVTVSGPLGAVVQARYGLIDETAVIETAEACGLVKLCAAFAANWSLGEWSPRFDILKLPGVLSVGVQFQLFGILYACAGSSARQNGRSLTIIRRGLTLFQPAELPGRPMVSPKTARGGRTLSLGARVSRSTRRSARASWTAATSRVSASLSTGWPSSSA